MLSAVVGSALALRLANFSAESLWWDEVLTTYSAREPLSRVIESVRGHENAPPLYFILMSLWAKVFGMSDAALRLPSALMGAAAVAAMFRLAAEMFDSRTGLTAAALLAVSPIHIAYSQEARPYSLMVLLLILCAWAFVRMMRTASAPAQVAYVLAAALALLTHTFALFTLIALNAFWLVRWSRGRETGVTLRRWIMLNTAVLVLFGPWVPATIEVARMGLPWLMRSTPFHHAMVGYTGEWSALPMIALCAVAVVFALRRWDDRVLLLALLTLVPVLGPLLYGTFTTRYGIASLLGLLTLVAYGASSLGRWACVGIVAIAALNWTLTSSPGRARYVNYQQKIDVRAAARHVLAHAEAGEVVVAGSREIWHVLQHYTRDSQIKLVDDMSKADGGELWLVVPSASQDTPPGYDAVSRTAFDGLVALELHRTEPATTTGVPSTYPRN